MVIRVKHINFVIALSALVLLFQNCSPTFVANTSIYDNNLASDKGASPEIDDVPGGPSAKLGNYVVNTFEINKNLNESGDIVCKDHNDQLSENVSSFLSREESENTIKAILGINVDASIFGQAPSSAQVNFSNNHLTAMDLFSKDVANKFVDSLSQGGNSLWSCNFSESCTNTLLESLPQYLWRKKIDPDEKILIERKLKLYTANNEDQKKIKIQKLIEFLVQSPQFYLRNINSKASTGVSKVSSPLELAHRISFGLIKSAADKFLMDDIFAGKINTVEQVKSHFEQKIESDSFQEYFVMNFFGNWLEFKTAKDHAGDFNQESIRSFSLQEYDRILKLFRENKPIEHIIKDDNNYGVLNSKLFAYLTYRTPKVVHDNPNALQAEDSNVVHRGLYIMDRIICMDSPVELSAATTEQIDAILNGSSFPHSGNNLEKAAYHRSISSCDSCHRYIDNLSIGVEVVGPFGEIRTKYPNQTAIDLSLDPNTNQPYQLAGQEYNSMDSYLDILSKTVDIKSCFTKRLHGRLLANEKFEIKPCLMTDLFKQSESTGLKDILKNFINSSIINYKKKPVNL